MTLSRSNPRARGRWGFLFVAVVTSTLIFASLAHGFSQSEFELDKNATNDLQTEHLGVLKSKANPGATSLIVCERAGAPIPATPFTILIDGEELTVSGFGNTAGTGGCSFSDPADSAAQARAWNLQSATAAAHPGASDVTGLTAGSVDGDDWDDVYASVLDDIDNGITDNHECESLGATACTWTHDDFNVSVFTTGGSKDDLNVNPVAGEAGTGWKWTNSSVPPSDEILDAFAVKYDVAGRQLLFFGADRWSTNGAKDMGFWFFHDEVSLNADGTFSGNHTRPTAGPDTIPGNADDTRGDILLLSTFTQGGAITTIRVFEWVGVGGNTNGTLQSIGAFGDCVPGNLTDNGCNTVNDTTVPSPWPYQGAGSSQVAGVLYAGALAEGGIDLTALNLQGCFASFMAETRSSPEPGAQLKDFALGGFESCESAITTTPANGTGTALTDTDDPVDGLVDTQIGTGATGVDVTDTALVEVEGLSTWTGTVDFYICGPIDLASEDCETGGVFASTEDVSNSVTTANSDSVNLTEVGEYCWRGEFKPSAASAAQGLEGDVDFSENECFEVKPVTPILSTTAWSSGDANGSAQTGDVPFGSPVYDKAALSGTANRPGDNGGTYADGEGTTVTTPYTSINATNGTEANGTITFTLVGPDGSATDCTTVAGELAGTTGDNPETVDVKDSNGDPSGDGDYFTSGFTPDEPGDYHWKASYSGDSPNTTSASHNDDCDETAEDVTVEQLQPTMSTAQSFVPNDSATITVDAGAGDLDGAVVFELFVDDPECDGTAAYTSSQLAVSDTDDAGDTSLTDTVSSANTTAYSADGTTFDWVVTFTSNNSAHLGVTSGCGNETSSITIDNGATQPETTP